MVEVSALEKAWQDRVGLHADAQTRCYRVFHGYVEGYVGLEIERFGSLIVMHLRKDGDPGFQEAAEFYAKQDGIECVVGKSRDQVPKAYVGTIPSDFYARELGLYYSIKGELVGNPGLYLDARPARKWLFEHSKDRRILNLFSFAGSLGVAALAGGARSVTHVDSQKGALKRCLENHARNGQEIDRRDLVSDDVYRYLKKASTKKRQFGGIIVDPPPIRKGSSKDRERFGAIGVAKACAESLHKGAWLLCFYHHDLRSWDELEAATIEATGAGKTNALLKPIWRSVSGSDLPESDSTLDLRLSAFEVL